MCRHSKQPDISNLEEEQELVRLGWREGSGGFMGRKGKVAQSGGAGPGG